MELRNAGKHQHTKVRGMGVLEKTMKVRATRRTVRTWCYGNQACRDQAEGQLVRWSREVQNQGLSVSTEFGNKRPLLNSVKSRFRRVWREPN